MGAVNTFLHNGLIYYVDKYGEDVAEYILEYFLGFLLKYTDGQPLRYKGQWMIFDGSTPEYIKRKEKKIFDLMYDLLYKDHDIYNAYYWFFINVTNICRENFGTNGYMYGHVNPYADCRSIFFLHNTKHERKFTDLSKYTLRYIAERASYSNIIKTEFSNQNLILGRCESSNKDYQREIDYVLRIYNILPGIYTTDNTEEKCIQNLKKFKKTMKNSFKSFRGRLFGTIINDWKAFREADPVTAAMFLKMATDLYTGIMDEKPHSITKFLKDKGVEKYLYDKYVEFWKKNDEEKYKDIRNIREVNSTRYFQISVDPIRKLSEMAAEKGDVTLEDICMCKKFCTVKEIDENLSKFTTEQLIRSGNINRTGLGILKRTVKKYLKAQPFRYDTSKWIVAGEEITKETSDKLVGILKEAGIVPYKILVTKKVAQYVKCGKDMDKFWELNPEIKKRIDKKGKDIYTGQ